MKVRWYAGVSMPGSKYYAGDLVRWYGMTYVASEQNRQYAQYFDNHADAEALGARYLREVRSRGGTSHVLFVKARRMP